MIQQLHWLVYLRKVRCLDFLRQFLLLVLVEVWSQLLPMSIGCSHPSRCPLGHPEHHRRYPQTSRVASGSGLSLLLERGATKSAGSDNGQLMQTLICLVSYRRDCWRRQAYYRALLFDQSRIQHHLHQCWSLPPWKLHWFSESRGHRLMQFLLSSVTKLSLLSQA